jgi:periplasmic divalent cation tolerance protein
MGERARNDRSGSDRALPRAERGCESIGLTPETLASSEFLLVLSTAATREEGTAIGRRLVEERLAACVNVVPAARSVFFWQGALEEADEALLIVKTRRDRYAELERRIRDLHSYSVPEVIAVEITAGSAPYLAWVRETASPGGGESSA